MGNIISLIYFKDLPESNCYINFIAVFSSQLQIMVGSNSQSNPGTVYQLSDSRIVSCILFYIFILFTLYIVT